MGDLRGKIGDTSLSDPQYIESTKLSEEVTPISIHSSHLDRHIMFGTELTEELQDALVSQGNVPRIDPCVAVHKLFAKPDHPPICYKRRKFAPKLLKVVEEEESKLVNSNIIIESHYSDWLANAIVTPKNGKK